MQSATSSQHLIARHPFAHHAKLRMQQRGIPERQVEAVRYYGRTIHARGLSLGVIGARYVREGAGLEHGKGIRVLAESAGSVVTAYWNHDLREIHPFKRWHAMCR